MSVALGLAFADNKWHLLRATAGFRRGSGQLFFEGQVGQEITVTLSAALQAATELSNFIEGLDPDLLSIQDLYIKIEVANVPVLGASYGLPLTLAILGAAIRRPVPIDTIYTGCIGPSGEVLPVEKIKEKRLAAKRLGFDKIMLPGSQLDMMNTQIHQYPVHNIREAFAVTFFGDENG